MPPTDKDRLQTLFDRLIDLSPEDQLALLDDECADEPDLRRAVEDLLRTEASTEGIREALAPPRNDDAGGSMIGETIGRCKILSVLGEGGFGVVYEGEQTEPVRRRVAVKVIKPGMDSKAVLARFEAERQALAVMEHACIARVFDGGVTDRGRSYFVMELVKGEPITDSCDRHRLPVAERIDLFIRVCEAIQHAHMKGVIHRDLKPSNILVAYDADGRVQPKVIDFGVAKALNQQLSEQTIFTEQGQLIGTPEYMSPEQAEMSGLDIDTRSDVYSLGVVLYQLLTGMLPFDPGTFRSGGIAEIQRLIREVDPPKPSTRLSTAGTDDVARRIIAARDTDVRELTTTLKRDLDWIVMRCLEKDRARRYDSARDIADELRRYLNHEPVLAGPPGARYRFGKFVRRHRTGVAAGMIVGIALLAGTAVSLGFALSETRQRRIAEDALEGERLAKEEAEQIADFQAEQLRDIDVTRMGERLRASILDSVPAGEVAMRDTLETALAEINFTDVGLASLEETIFSRALATIDDRFGDRPLLRARLLHVVARTMGKLGLIEQAESPMRRSLELRIEHLGQANEDTLKSMQDMGSLLSQQGRYDEAGPYLRDAYEGCRTLLGDDNHATLGALNDLALFTKRNGRPEDAEAYYLQALEGCRRLLGDDHVDTMVMINNVGSLMQDLGRPVEAESYYREALDGRRRTLGDDHPHTMVSVSNMGHFLMTQRKFDDARPLLEQSLAADRLRYGNDHQDTLSSLSVMGGMFWMAGDYDDAEPHFAEAYETALRVYGPDHPRSMDGANNMGLLRHSQGRYDEAERFHRISYEARRRNFGPDHPQTLKSTERLASSLMNLGRYRETEALALECERRRRDRSGADNRGTQAAVEALITLYERWAEAEPGAGHEADAARWRATRDGGAAPDTGGL